MSHPYPAAQPAGGPLAPAAVAALRRMFVLFAVLNGVLLVGATGVLVLSVSSAAGGRRFVLPAVPGSLGAVVALGVTTLAAVVAAGACRPGGLDGNLLGVARRLGLAAQVVAVMAALFAVGAGAILAAGESSALPIGVGVGVPTALVAFLAGTVRRSATRAAGQDRPGDGAARGALDLDRG